MFTTPNRRQKAAAFLSQQLIARTLVVSSPEIAGVTLACGDVPVSHPEWRRWFRIESDAVPAGCPLFRDVWERDRPLIA